MAMTFDPKHETALNDLMQDIPGAEPGKMFGMPCYKVRGKMVAGVFETGIVVKVGMKKTQEMTKSGTAQPFEPLPGRRWKEWVLLTSDFEKHQALFKDAVKMAMKGG